MFVTPRVSMFTVSPGLSQFYYALGGPTGRLGQATGPETPIGSGSYQSYQGGRIYWSYPTGGHAVFNGAMLDQYLANGGPTGRLGFPTTNETPSSATSTYQQYQGGIIYWSANDGVSTLTTSQQIAAQILSDGGFSNAQAIVQAAHDTGLPLGIAAALMAKESMGANVYGHDAGGAMSGAGEVTQQNFTQQFLPAILSGAISNGVGPSQITYPGYFVQNQNLAWWDPYTNMCFGFKLMAGYLNGDYSDASLIAAGSTYNSGTATGAPWYGQSFDQLAVNWTNLLAGT